MSGLAREFGVFFRPFKCYHRLLESNKLMNLMNTVRRSLAIRNFEVYRTMDMRSLVMLLANTSVKPAKGASILGEIKHAIPAAPTIADESRLKRIDIHRITMERQYYR